MKGVAIVADQPLELWQKQLVVALQRQHSLMLETVEQAQKVAGNLLTLGAAQNVVIEAQRELAAIRQAIDVSFEALAESVGLPKLPRGSYGIRRDGQTWYVAVLPGKGGEAPTPESGPESDDPKVALARAKIEEMKAARAARKEGQNDVPTAGSSH